MRFVIVSSGPVLRWQARVVESLAAVPGVTILRWLTTPPAGLPPRSRGPASQESSVAWPGDPVQIMEAGPAVADEPRADVVLDLTPTGWPAAASWAAVVWHYAYGDSSERDPVRAALIDWVANPGRSRVALVAEPGRTILREGRLAWWRGAELERLLADPAGWPATAARDQLEGGSPAPAVTPWPDPERTADEARERAGRERLRQLPTSLLGIAAVGRRIEQAPRVATNHDGWNVGIVDAPIEQFLTADEPFAASWLPARRGHFVADPFGVERDGTLHVFLEDYDQRLGRGTIGHVAVAPDGTPSDVAIVLDPGVHASYPYVIETGGETWLLPETSTADEVVLYECVEFPLHWQRGPTLLSGVAAVDATVFEWEGRWWLFATDERLGPNHSLLIWHAPSLTGPWTAHDRNPVKTDSRSSRPGGTPFVVDGRLYRPSQDCELAYGRRLILNVVEELTPSRFVERPVRILTHDAGSRYPGGFHTLARAGRRTLVDGNARGLVRETLRLTAAKRIARARGRAHHAG